jgi:hypothetical protein
LRPFGIVRRSKKTAWHWSRGVSKIRRFGYEPPSNRKGELPMELTAKLTAVMAIISFGFLAAVILGMI